MEGVRGGKGELQIEETRRAGRHALKLRGELDSATAPNLEAALHKACSEETSEIALDLSALTFMDSSGLLAVVRGYKMCSRTQHGFMVAPGNGAARDLFDACGMVGVAPFLEIRPGRDHPSPDSSPHTAPGYRA
ncbi:MAG TPA: STAS domain-containing protein [Solirubrobacteraceae bacterium]|nr:STAS domain-containing protein [Solirubrobacteraceae bacterium]